MLSEDRYFQILNEDEVWLRYCGFLDLHVDEFMEIQKELLMDEIERIADSVLGQKIMGNDKPEGLEEFRSMVPLTTYDDYEPYLSERQEDALAIKPAVWCHSAGRGGRFKWIPLSSEFLDKITKNALASYILATTNEKGKVNFWPGAKMLAILAPPPYGSGLTVQTVAQHFSLQSLPDPNKTRHLPFPDRIQKGFQMALREGVDIIGSLPSILVRMGEEFGEQKRGGRFSLSTLHPKVMRVLLQAWLRSKKQRRRILPKDLWPTKAIFTGGMDAHIYKADIIHYWGREPYEIYISSEAFHIAMHGWNKRWMTFVPDMVFLEFIPYKELLKHEEDKDYQPSTVLLNEVKEGQLYEVVITQFYGMPLLRYRLRDLIRIVALKDDEAGVNLPQMTFQRRVDEVINIGGLAQLDEKTVWQAMSNAGIRYKEWTACKEDDQNKTFLCLYIEPIEQTDATELEMGIDEQLKIIDTDYKDIHYYLGYQPVRVKLLSPGTFQRYTEEKVKEGADQTHLKPAHINPPETVIKRILQLSKEGGDK